MELLKRWQKSDVKKYLSPTLEELFNACVELEKKYKELELIAKHGLVPGVDTINETLTIADRIRGIVKQLVEKEASKRKSSIPKDAYQAWYQSWANFEKKLDTLKRELLTIGIGEKEAVIIKIFNFISEYTSFIRATVYPAFQNYFNLIVMSPEVIYDPIESKFALLFVRRFKIVLPEEEEE
ncbi:MAG: hypothetical protein ACTSUR_02920 [Candidatus Heimdallarchaeaceae archaeon]